ncbi:MAG: DNA repair protein RecO [Halieaceae bacterium]|jgi:DNA repair protein RecO (recombination protein O)|nr:DNA repair protein RecO [Halieaceae bacterium]
MRIQLQPGYLLHRRPYRDSSDLLEVFTLEHGRLGAVARGLGRRRSGGPLAAVLQPFRPLLLSLSGRGDLLTLTAVESGGVVPPLVGESLFSGFYLNELVLRALQRHEAHSRLFLAYAEAVAALARDDGRARIACALRRFELALVDELGYAVSFHRLADDSAALCAQRRYRLVPGEGFFVADDGPPDPRVFDGAHLLQIADGELEQVPPSVLRGLTQALLADHVGGEALRSSRVFREVSGGVARGTGSA